jgi:hypothetical protein
MLNVVSLIALMLKVVTLCCYTECRYTECCGAEQKSTQCLWRDRLAPLLCLPFRSGGTQVLLACPQLATLAQLACPIDIERKNRLLKVCYVPTTSATFLAFFSFFSCCGN